jgi:hypothetical protein
MPNLTENTPPEVLRKNTRSFLDRKERERFYGVIAVRYENGIPVHIRAEESILPHKLETPNAPRNS